MALSASWTRDFFGPLYADIYGNHLLPPARSRQEAKFARDVLSLKSSLVLDVASGFGRHARLLAPTNRVHALDNNFEYLQAARLGLRGNAARNLNCACADFRHIPYRNQSFDAALLLFNSFGYVDDSGTAARDLLAEIARVLKPGAGFLIEVADRRSVVAAVREMPRRFLSADKCEMEEDFQFNATTHVLSASVRFSSPLGTRETGYRIRLYSQTELVRMLVAVGMVPVASFGSYDGEPYVSGQADALLIHARRKSVAISKMS